MFTVKCGRPLTLLLLTLIAVLAAPAASAQDVSSNYMPGTDFTKYKTYCWGNIQGGTHANQIMDAEIKSAVDKQLAAKGLTKVEDKADLTVA